MSKDEIKAIMRIVRPAIYAVYGRMPLRLLAYNIISEDSVWLEIAGDDFFKVRLEGADVTFLSKGRLGE